MHSKSFKLNNDILVPNLSFGFGRIRDGQNTTEICIKAIKAGYRHLDDSSGYGNVDEVLEGIKYCIKNNIVKREDLFITMKIGNQTQGYKNTLNFIEDILAKLDSKYIDAVLIHQPLDWESDWKRSIIDTYRALELLYKEEKIKAIGVSNFKIENLAWLMTYVNINPSINQIECHPYSQQRDLVEYCKGLNIKIEAWSPLLYVINDTLLKELAVKYNKTSAQIALKWSIQKGYIPICSSKYEEQMKENLDIYDFEISPEDMEAIDALDGGMYATDNSRVIVNYNELTARLAARLTPQKKLLSKTIKLFGFIPFLKEKKINDYKTKWYLWGIPILKITFK